MAASGSSPSPLDLIQNCLVSEAETQHNSRRCIVAKLHIWWAPRRLLLISVDHSLD